MEVAINTGSNFLAEPLAVATEQLLLRLPEELVRRFRRAVPSRKRSQFVQQLLEQALPRGDSDDDPLYLAALDVEGQGRLNTEMAEWEAAALKDGLDEAEGPAFRP